MASTPCISRALRVWSHGACPGRSRLWDGVGGTLCLARRAQSILGESRITARHSKTAYRHPLAPHDPAQRNVALAAPPRKGGRRGAGGDVDAALPATVLHQRAQKALLRQLQQEVLWEGTVLDDVNHKLIQHFVKLGHNPKFRSARGMAVVGGKEMIRELCERGSVPHHLLVLEGKEVPQWARRQRGMEIVPVTAPVAEACAPGGDGFVGDFDIPPPPLKERLIANQQRLRRVLVLDNVDDAGLLGTILRTAAGLHYDAVIATNHCADLYDHRVLRAARGAHFQTGVPIYTLREEDGDDVYGMLNHVMRRNALQPVCFVASPDDGDNDRSTADGAAYFTSSVVGARPIALPPRAPHAVTRQTTVSDFCLDQFARGSGGTAGSEGGGGYLVFAGPNHTGTMVRRLSRRVAAPVLTQLLVETADAGNLIAPRATDALIGMSVVLHALRPCGDWDYLPLDARTQPSTRALQDAHVSVDLGANRLAVGEEDLSWDEEEQVQQAHLRNEFMRWRRLHKRTLSDYEHWMQAEGRRVRAMQADEQLRRSAPWMPHTRRPREAKMPDWVPNIIDEYRQPVDRDRLQEEREKSEAYQRPSNYDK